METIEQLETIVTALNERVARVPLERFDDKTPCAAFKVRDLFNHFIGGASMVAPQLRGDDTPPRDPSTLSDPERRVLAQEELANVLDAVKAPGALGRVVALPFGEVPGEVVARFLTVDLMVHTWDLARSVGEVYEPPAELVEDVLETAHQLIAPEMRDGDTFAEEIDLPAGAPAIDRLVAFTGRAA